MLQELQIDSVMQVSDAGFCIALKESKPVKKLVSIRREAVLDLVKRMPLALTTKEMARMLGVKEVCVRAAISWLELGGFIRVRCHVVRTYERGNKRKIARWEWTGRKDPISPIRTKEVDEPQREAMKRCYGDGGLELQNIIFSIRGNNK